MEPRCPECLGVLELRENNTARCTIHGGEFEVLFVREDVLTPAYAGAPSPLDATGAPVSASHYCVQHTHLPATAQCKSCGAYMCDTCAFDAGGGIKICPTCAASPKTAMSPKRKKMLIGSFALAAWSTLIFFPLVLGAAALGQNEAAQEVLGAALIFLVLIPSIIGVALGVSSMERRMKTGIGTWIAISWNALILGGFLLMMIVGILMKGGD